MSEDDVHITIRLKGGDAEASAINAICYLLDTVSFKEGIPGGGGCLTSAQRARVTEYLAKRYALS